MSSSPDVIVVGAGVLGLCTAATLAGRGLTVTVVDPGGPNASSVAAGMIAPAFESLADGDDPERARLFRDARDAWPDFSARHGLPLYREGARWTGADASGVAARLTALGFASESCSDGTFTPDDWRTDPQAVLFTLSKVGGVASVRSEVQAIGPVAGGWQARTRDGETLAAGHLVIAAGAGVAALDLPTSVSALTGVVAPIRGQIGFIARSLSDHAVRSSHGYVAPATGGSVIGATMEPGRTDLDPDEDRGRALIQANAGSAVSGSEAVTWRVGIRGATPDGLPLAGSAGVPGLWLALAPRRNGWLLGPLIGAVVADAIQGHPPGPQAAAFDPGRFLTEGLQAASRRDAP
ncbi:FAD-dependent oxidoreductase [Brevundimonas sp.]|uniref:NAD(P)/FAD-dependent oxidoreductase n=1 Tax=Brevundimonas sp. TaxID=1871086 RepID=UPI002ABB7408|nr:FAD-dependent oxidoreductase [Brevundimonas sp.]MDZ4363363.1 FAD-dependent oxidoreductase [Brevundimonas sp.]